MKQLLILLMLTLSSIQVAFAATGSVDAGKTKAGVCAACHGANGIGASDTFPNLAGQHAEYLVKQLQAFKNGDRKDPLMAPMAANLSLADIADISAYFASLPRTVAQATPTADSNTSSAAVAAPVAYIANASAGKSLYELGDASRSIGACIGCHGKDGHSEVLIFPNLANQHPQYITKQLNNFKQKSRVDFAMNQFASALSAEEIADLGAYFADTSAVANVAVRVVKAAPVITKAMLAGKTKAAACASCHGADGNSPVPTYPKLAGQGADYLVKQLKEFKSGLRQDPIMAGMVAAMSEQDMQELASYFSSQKVVGSAGNGSAQGKKLYYGGDAKRNITACVACHGSDGKGMNKASFPALAGQNADYIKAQLLKFKNAQRTNDHNAMMQNVAVKLKNKDIDALASYLATLK